MTKLVELLKERIEYTEKNPNCSSCIFIELDMSTDNFGVGDLCVRNPDIHFITRSFAYCNKWEPKND